MRGSVASGSSPIGNTTTRSTPQATAAAGAPNASLLQDDDAELVEIEEVMARLRTRKDRLQQLEDLEQQEGEMEAKRRKLQ